MNWYDETTARAVWNVGAPAPAALAELLTVARDQCLAYAPVAPGVSLPAGHRMAQLMQARNLWNASQVQPGGQIGEGTFALTIFPLDWQVKQLLRPERAVPVVG